MTADLRPLGGERAHRSASRSRLAAVALALTLAFGPAAAQERRLLDADEAEAFRAVGRLNVAGSRFCTATLIAPDEVLTAAHCLYHPRTGQRVPLRVLRFVPAHRIETNAGVWRVERAAIGTGFAPSDAPSPAELRSDVALLRLEAPVPAAAATPFAVGPLSPSDPPTSIVSYARDRAEAPSISESCPAMGAIREVLVLDCAVERGISGAPVLLGQGEAARLVAIVSAMGSLPDGEAFALTVLAAPWIDTLRAELADAADADDAADGADGGAETDAEPEPPNADEAPQP